MTSLQVLCSSTVVGAAVRTVVGVAVGAAVGGAFANVEQKPSYTGLVLGDSATPEKVYLS